MDAQSCSALQSKRPVIVMDWREFLYPLGFISSLAFGGRFALQWLSSEYKKKSTVSRGFWILSLIGNICLGTHAFIQLQYHVCFVQTCNSVISWRNINLMEPDYRRYRLRTVLTVLISMLAVMTSLFYITNESTTWFRIPTHSLTFSSARANTPLFVHLFGFIGIALFSSRFWVQWWFAEKHQQSYLGKGFWWLSLIGDLMSITYFAYIGDAVNFIGPAIGTVPYVRNLMLMRNSEKEVYESGK